MLPFAGTSSTFQSALRGVRTDLGERCGVGAVQGQIQEALRPRGPIPPANTRKESAGGCQSQRTLFPGQIGIQDGLEPAIYRQWGTRAPSA